MTQLLILGTAILAMEPLQETDEEIIAIDSIYPKHVILGWQLVDATVPEDFTPSTYYYHDGNVYLKPVEVPHPTLDDYTNYIQNWMNGVASTRGYDSIITASLRAALPESPYHTEGVIFGQWMDNVWYEHFRLLGQANSGTMPWPTFEKLIAMLPPAPEFARQS